MSTKFFRRNCTGERGKVNGERKPPFSLSPFSVLRRYCLLLLFLCPALLSAQNGITVSGLVIEAGTVTFNVSWKNTDMPTPWSDTVWVWVDYNDAGTMKRLPVTTATV